MQVEFNDDVFRSGNDHELSYLIKTCLYRNRYDVFVPMHKVKNENSFKQLSQVDRSLLEAQFNAQTQNSRKRANVKISELRKSTEYFNIEEGNRYLGQPVSVILENSLNDKYFLEAIIKFLATEDKIKRHIQNGWLQFENAGGCNNVGNLIEAKSQSYDTLPKNNYRYLRCFALLDSDKDYPNAPRKPFYNSLLPELEEKGVSYHVLIKRAMENYMPDEAVWEIDQIKQSYRQAYMSLTPLQKDFFNIHLGFGNVSDRSALRVEVAALFDSISDSDFQILNKGAQMGNFKSEFPKFMQNYQVYKISLKKRTSHQTESDELENILQAIEALL